MNKYIRRGVVTSVISTQLVSCVGITSQSFYANPSQASDYQICKSWKSTEDIAFKLSLKAELESRGKSLFDCQRIMDERHNAIAIGAILGAALIAISQSGGGGSGSAPSYATDYDYAWDQFRNEYGQLVWACRGKQTGQFAYKEKCQYKSVNDYTWPTK